MRLRCPHAHLCVPRMKLPRMKLPRKLPRMCVPSMTCPLDDLEYRVCSSVQAPVLTGPYRCVRRGPPRGQPHARAARLYLRSLATGVLGATSFECSTLSGPRICEADPSDSMALQSYSNTGAADRLCVCSFRLSVLDFTPKGEPTLSLQQLCIHCIPCISSS